MPEEFVRLVLQERFWVMDIPFVRMIKFEFLAHFPGDHLAHPFVSSLVLFHIITDYVIYRFVSITT